MGMTMAGGQNARWRRLTAVSYWNIISAYLVRERLLIVIHKPNASRYCLFSIFCFHPFLQRRFSLFSLSLSLYKNIQRNVENLFRSYSLFRIISRCDRFERNWIGRTLLTGKWIKPKRSSHLFQLQTDVVIVSPPLLCNSALSAFLERSYRSNLLNVEIRYPLGGETRPSTRVPSVSGGSVRF